MRTTPLDRCSRWALFIFFAFLFLMACKKHGAGVVELPRTTDPKVLKLGPNTIWVDSLTATCLKSLDSVSMIFSGNTTQLGQLQKGSILVSGIAPNAPYGYLRMVTGITQNGSDYHLITEPATLTSAFEELHVSDSVVFTLADAIDRLSFDLNLSNITVYGNAGDLITFDGQAQYTPSLAVMIQLSNSSLQYAKIGVVHDISLSGTVKAGGKILDFSTQHLVFHKDLEPFVIPETPIVIVPAVDVSIGANGNADVSITYSYTRTHTAETYIEYSNGDWHTGASANDEDNVTQFTDIDGKAALTLFLQPSLDMQLWGLNNAKAGILANAYVTAEGHLQPYPGCSLTAGLTGGVSVDMSILGSWGIKKSYPDLLAYSREIYHCSACGLATSVTDVDSNVYAITDISGRCWTKSNLKVTHYDNGDPILEVTDNIAWVNQLVGARCSYNAGMYYNWYACTDFRGLCPVGWHVPDSAEFWEMVSSLGDPFVVGGLLKDSVGWGQGGGGSNSSGFSARPGGWRDEVYGTWFDDNDASFWTTSFDPTNSWDPDELQRSGYNVILYSDANDVGLGAFNRRNGLNVRCIKDTVAGTGVQGGGRSERVMRIKVLKRQ